MLFYKAECTTKNPINEDKEKEEIRVKCEIFNSQTKQPFVCFYRLGENQCSIAAAIDFNALEHNTIKSVFERFLSSTGVNAKIDSISEVATRSFAKYIELADRASLIQNQYETLDGLNIDGVMHKLDCEIRVTDKIIEHDKTKLQNFAQARQIACAESLCAELERIYGGKQDSFFGHPAHYIISSNDSTIADEIQNILFSALFDCKRVMSRRVSEVHAHKGLDGLNDLYSMSKGGTIVVNIKDEGDDEEYATGADNLIQICKSIKEHKHSVLSVICCSLSNKKMKERVVEQIPDVAFVELREDIIFNDGAKKYLRGLARAKGVTKCASLLAKVATANKGEAGFRAGELNKIFGTWYDDHLRTKIFAGYKELKPPIAKNTTPKGSAYSELQSMVGLASVKKVIKEAIDYHKVQKFLRESSEISRHMVFTGNPGTAKTTVARLFSQIMKDNGLLSDGTFVEVGRADLIGKYVGHTAPKVKDAFKRAEGGVLFIDEAYSLVDDKRGLYGDEAINTIVQEMENRRESVVVIFAGYPKEMEDFLLTNPGLRSRIAYHVGFDDYNAGELLEILKLMTSKKKFSLADGADKKNLEILKQASKSKDFGNGRYVRNLFERATMKQATRLVEIGLENIAEHEKNLLISADFEPISLGKTKANMGFKM